MRAIFDPLTVFLTIATLVGICVEIAVFSALVVLLWLSLGERFEAWRARKKREEQTLVMWEQVDDIVGASSRDAV